MGPGLGSLLTLDPSGRPSWPDWSAAVVAATRGADRSVVLAAVAEQVAGARGHALSGLALQLPVGEGIGAGVRPGLPELPADLAGPDLLGAVDELLLDPAERRARGAHYTSPDLALALLDWALDDWDPPVWRRFAVDSAADGAGEADGVDGGDVLVGGRFAVDSAADDPVVRVLDAAVGGGAFLLAAARWLVGQGVAPAAVLPALAGTDLDPVAVAAAEAALVLWALDHGVDVAATGLPEVRVGDGLDHRRPPPFDLVVGNPPFLGQLARDTARPAADAERIRARFGTAAGPYTDTAALFLVAGCQAARPGGRVVLVQPESVLGARDGRGARAATAALADVVGLWVAGEPAFAAEVDVCVPVLELRAADTPPDRPVRRAWGIGVDEREPSPLPTSRSWAPLLAAGRGVPEVALARDRCVGDLASATAGFRQHFYGLVPHLRELADEAPSPFLPPASVSGEDIAPLVTVGTVDPLAVLWGERPTRVAGQLWLRPVVDLATLAAEEPEVARWVGSRMRPKVLVAPQTRVVEAAVDPGGRIVPGVPLVAVEPLDGAAAALPDPPRGDAAGGDEWVLWLLVAALSAPPISAWALYESAGTARHGDAVKLAARQVRAVPLPVDDVAWAAAAAALRAGRPLAEVGPDLTVAYGLDADHPVTAWWSARLPRP